MNQRPVDVGARQLAGAQQLGHALHLAESLGVGGYAELHHAGQRLEEPGDGRDPRRDLRV
jgi:hypothetical protein